MIEILLFAPEYRPNLSSMIRSCEFYGLKRIYIYDKNRLMVPPKTSAGKSEMQHMAKVWTAGAIDFIEIISIDDPITFLKKYEGRKIATLVDEKAQSMDQFDFEINDLIVMGSEKNGLSEEVIPLFDKSIYIKQRGNTNCLNVAVSLGIVLNSALENIGK